MLKSKELINKVKSYNKFLNPETLTKAYEFALKAHKTQKRDEGVPYIIHPVAVADILSDLKLDSATIATGLLHDTIEDTKATYKTVEKEFGKEVADLVEEPLEEENLNIQNTTKRNFHEEIKPDKKLNTKDKFDISEQIDNFKETENLEIEENIANSFGKHDKLNSEQVPFKDLESLYRIALKEKDVLGLVIGTRPDCLPKRILKKFEEIELRSTNENQGIKYPIYHSKTYQLILDYSQKL